jgi:hypothetical protein
MLKVLDTKSRTTPPLWLHGAADLQHTTCADGDLWGIGDAALLGNDGPWIALPDGYSVGGEVDPAEIRKPQAWSDTASAIDGEGRWWSVPALLSARGGRNFRVAYGLDWMPSLTAEQARLEQIAQSARQALTTGEDVPMPVACQWAAELLAAMHYVSPQVLAAMRCLDDMLVAQALAIASGVAIVRESSDHG